MKKSRNWRLEPATAVSLVSEDLFVIPIVFLSLNYRVENTWFAEKEIAALKKEVSKLEIQIDEADKMTKKNKEGFSHI